MRTTALSIWRVPACLPYLQPELTDAAVATAEAEIGYRLPAEYLSLLREQNGGYLRYSLPGLPHDTIAGIGPNFPALCAPDWSEVQDQVSFALRGLIPIDGDGHWHLCLDYRTSTTRPSITFVEIDRDRETPVAESFAAYLAALRIDVGDEHVLESLADLDGLKRNLERRLDFRFDPPETWAHGFPIHRGRLGTGSRPQWLWISPNTVQRGFVRPEDRRYPELKDMLPGVDDRYPGLPAGSFILEATDEVRTSVLDAVARSGLTLRPLREYLRSD